MRITTLVGMPHGEHDPDKAEVLCVGGRQKVQRFYKELKRDCKGVHEKYFYVKILGNNPHSTRFVKPSKTKPVAKPKVKSLTEGAKKVVKEAKLTPEQIQEIEAGEDNKIYKKEAEAYVKNKLV